MACEVTHPFCSDAGLMRRVAERVALRATCIAPRWDGVAMLSTAPLANHGVCPRLLRRGPCERDAG